MTPVVDFVLNQPCVDSKRIALMGQSMGGELAPQAAAFETRIAALIADDGIFDFSSALLSKVLPEHLVSFKQQLTAEHAPQVDEMLANMMKSPVVRWAILQGMYSFAVKTPREFVAATLKYNVGKGIAEKITCPTLVCEAQGDENLQGQPQALYDHLTCPKIYMRFTTSEGAGDHCHEGAKRLAFGRMYDWLDDTFAS